jgi:hypothetical protein
MIQYGQDNELQSTRVATAVAATAQGSKISNTTAARMRL